MRGKKERDAERRGEPYVGKKRVYNLVHPKKRKSLVRQTGRGERWVDLGGK